MKTLIKTISSFFYVGYLPLIPGTFGSLAGLFLYFLVRENIITYILFTLTLIIVGLLVCGRAEKIYKKKDPRCIVIDEVCGMLLSLLFIPFELKYVIAGFFLFRLLDTLKPYPAGAIQEREGSLGVMGDDIVAGLYANIILQLVQRFATLRAS